MPSLRGNPTEATTMPDGGNFEREGALPRLSRFLTHCLNEKIGGLLSVSSVGSLKGVVPKDAGAGMIRD